MKKTVAILLLIAVMIVSIQPVRAQEGPSIPRLSDSQLLEIVSQPQYLPGSYQSTAQGSSHTDSMASSAEDMRESWTLAADRLDEIIERYGWESVIGAEYNTCQPADRAISGINIDVSQLSSPEAARAFIDDPGVRAYFEALFFEITDSPLFHGWIMGSLYTDEGECFPEEAYYSLIFEYWGLLFEVDVMVQAGTDPALPIDMANQIAWQIIPVVDRLYASGFPATPMPSPSTTSLTGSLTLDNLARVLPSAEDVNMPPDVYQLNQDVSRIFTLNDIVTSYRNLNLTALADALLEVGTAHGMLGQGVRLWEPLTSCPDIYGLSIEIDIALFTTADGPTGYMSDPAFQQAWMDTGLLNRFEPQPNGTMLVYGSLPNYHCGPAKIIERMIPLDRALVTVALTSYQEIPDDEVIEIVDAFALFATGKIRFLAAE